MDKSCDAIHLRWSVVMEQWV